MSVHIPTCPSCKNKKTFYIMRQTALAAEDSTKPKVPEPPGAGVTHPAFDMVQVQGVTVVCRKCGNMFMDPAGFVT